MRQWNRHRKLALLLVVASASVACWADNAEELRTAISESPQLVRLDGLNLADNTAGLYRMVLKAREVSQVAEPVSADPPSDQHTLSFYQVSDLIIENSYLEASVVEEALKFSDCHRVWVRNCTIIGGQEDALDVVRGSDMLFENVDFVSRGARAVTLKGGVSNVIFKNCRFSGSATTGAFIEIGDWTNYNYEPLPPTQGIHIDSSNDFDCPIIRVHRGSNHRQLRRTTIRPIRTYYVADIDADHSTEVLTDGMVAIYFEVQRMLKIN